MYRNYRELEEWEIAEISELYPVTPNREISRRYNISVDALKVYLAKARGWKKDRKAVLIGSRGGRSLTEKELQWIIRHYKHVKNSEIMDRYGIGESTLHRVARKYGLKKTRAFVKKTQQAAKEASYEVCRDYGVYEETSRRQKERLADLRARGERIPGSFMPGRSNKDRLSPRRFKEVMKKIHEKRRETIRKERVRLHFGLPQKSALRLSYNGYGKRERKKAIHRHLFRKAGYIVDYGDDTVYYDNETERHPIMEDNAYKWGLKVEMIK